MTAKIVVVGSFNMDLTSYMPRMPRPGETLHGTRFQTGPGGKGSNQAVAAARLGADVTFVGRVGTDIFADNAFQVWNSENINTRYVIRDPENPTGVAPIWVEETTGQNAIVVILGANKVLSRQDIDSAAEAIARADILIAQLETDIDATAYALKLAKQSNVRTILNPAPAATLPDEMIANADILTPNETELEVLSRRTLDDIDAAARSLIRRDDQTIVVTLGAGGAQIVTSKNSINKPAIEVQPVDTTGAGDCFTGALAVALGEGKTLDEAVQFANTAAGICVTRPGTAPSMPSRQEVDALIPE